MAYVIGSDNGKKKAEEMKAGESWYNTNDGSTWAKQKDGTISVTTSKGEVFDNAYSPTSGGGQYSPYTGSSTGIQTYNSSQEAIKNQMNANSIEWWSADDERKKVLESQNRELSKQLGGNVTYNPGTGTWSGAAANNMYTTTDIEGWGKDYAENNPKPTAPKGDPRIDALLNEILNRDDFSYDAASDPLYQQYAQMYQREGDRAMKETMAEAAAGAGGMNTYAVTAAQQANNYYMSQLNDRIPELYQLAYEMYLNDKESMVQDLGLLQQMDNTQYNRYRDTISDYYNDKNFAYNSFYDAVQQGNWQTNFDYNAMWDNKNYNTDQYWKNKDEEWRNMEWIANRADVDFDKNNVTTDKATNNLLELMDMGVMPNDNLIEQAGWDKNDVANYVANKQKELAAAGIVLGGSTSTGVSSSGGGTPKKKTDPNYKPDYAGYEPEEEKPSNNSNDQKGDEVKEVKPVSNSAIINLGIGAVNEETIEQLALAGAVAVKNDGSVYWINGYNSSNWQTALDKLYNTRTYPFL